MRKPKMPLSGPPADRTPPGQAKAGPSAGGAKPIMSPPPKTIDKFAAPVANPFKGKKF